MIIEYLRPSTIDEALQYLQRKEPITLPLGGGTVLSRKHRNDEIAVVDLQQVGLDTINKTGDILSIGSASTLQTLVEQDDLHAALKLAITREININMRRMATIGGTIISADGCSPLFNCPLGNRREDNLAP